MPSPLCTVNGSATVNGVDVTGATIVTIQLVDVAGAKSWSITCISTDDVNDKAIINSGLSVDAVTKTATFTAPSLPNGSALLFESKVNGGKDADGKVDPTLTTRFGVYVLTSGGARVGAFDETMEGSATFGWLRKINKIIRDTSLVQLATSNPTPNTLAARDGSGASSFSAVTADTYNSSASDLTLSPNGGDVVTAGAIRAGSYKLGSAVQVDKYVPLVWNTAYSMMDAWRMNSQLRPESTVITTDGYLRLGLNFPNGVKIVRVEVRFKGGGTSASPLPAVMPVFTLISETISSGIQSFLDQESDPSGTAAAFRDTPHGITLIPTTTTFVDNATKQYMVRVSPESGALAITGDIVYAVRVIYEWQVGQTVMPS